MAALMKTAISAAVLSVAAMGAAHAGVLDLTSLVSGANVYSFGDFNASSINVQGSIVAAGNVTINSFSVNEKNKDAYGSYALIAGGDLNSTGGKFLNGDSYVGGKTTLTGASTATPVQNGKSPVNFAATETKLTQTSQSLAKLSATSKAEEKYGGIYITGSNKAVEVINIDSSWLKNSNYYNLSGMAKGATLIVNVSGSSAVLHDGYDAFNGYNVLFNLSSATSLAINTGVNFSLLAPNAVANGGGGSVSGNVVVDSWAASSMRLSGTNNFQAVDVQGFAAAVPEPATSAMLLAGLGMIGLIGRRRQKVAAAAR